MTQHSSLAILSLVSLTLASCGGGGGSGIAFVPPPPPPQQPQSVEIFPNPTVGEFASVGASAKVADLIHAGAPIEALSLADADQPHIRYTSQGTYEIELDSGTWDQLTFYGRGTDRTYLNNGSGSGGLIIGISGSKDKGYQYSELASYISGDTSEIGAFAFGGQTPNGSVPVTGSATYNGIVMGSSDVVANDYFSGPSRASVDGSVTLNFNFAAGSLDGSMNINLEGQEGLWLALGRFAFKDTIYSSGSTSYSGKFDSAATGDNFFSGKFTGPHGEETIGAWALPFVTNASDGSNNGQMETHQAFGAWIAKNH